MTDSYDTRGPLSLQDQSFISILANLEKFPVELLSLLPKTWRIKLLRAAPPLHLYRLESTPVSMGIDTDVFWQEMSTLKDSVWGDYIVTEQYMLHSIATKHTKNSMRARFINYIYYLLFNENNRVYASKRATQLLLSIHMERLDHDVVRKMRYNHVPTKLMFTPPHYFVPFRCPSYGDKQIVSILVSMGALPKALEISDLSVFFEAVLSKHDIKSCFREMTLLRLDCTQYSGPLLRLTKKKYGKHTSMAPNFGTLDSLELVGLRYGDIESTLLYFTSPYSTNKLKRLQVEMLSPTQIPTTFSRVINDQRYSLEHVSLVRVVFNMTGFSVVDEYHELCKFVSYPQFKSLTVSNVKNLPQLVIEEILLSFLKTEPDHKQVLYFKNCSITKHNRRLYKAGLTRASNGNLSRDSLGMSIACTTHKSIIFEDVEFPMEFFTWLEKLDSIFLHSLEFKYILIQPELPSRGIKLSEQRYVSCPKSKSTKNKQSETKTLNKGREKEFTILPEVPPRDDKFSLKSTYIDDKPKTGLTKTKVAISDPVMIFYTHPNFRCLNFSWHRADSPGYFEA